MRCFLCPMAVDEEGIVSKLYQRALEARYGILEYPRNSEKLHLDYGSQRVLR